jgi:hypothetical protein
MATTANQGLPYQTLADPPHGPDLGRLLALAVESKLVMRFASIADRTARVPAPTIGMMSWLDDLQRLEVYSTAPAAGWVPMLKTPYTRVIDTAGVNQPTTNVAALVTWDTNVILDPVSMHSLVTNTSRLIAPIPGVYQINCSLRWNLNATGTRALNIRKNAAGNSGGGTSLFTATVATLPSNQPSNQTTFSQTFAAGDYIEAFATQTSGGPLTLAGLGSFFEFIWQRPVP